MNGEQKDALVDSIAKRMISFHKHVGFGDPGVTRWEAESYVAEIEETLTTHAAPEPDDDAVERAAVVLAAFLESMEAAVPKLRTCVVPGCGTTFIPRASNQRTCGAKACVQHNNGVRKKRAQREPRICGAEGCGREFVPRTSQVMTCGLERCKREYRRARQREYNVRKYQERKEAAA